MSIAKRLHAVVHPSHHAGFDRRRSVSYDRMSRRVLRSLYRKVAADVAAIAPESATVLDVGTGPGRLLHELADRRPDLALTGVDPSPYMIEVAEQAASCRSLGHRVRFQIADVADLPHPDGSVDVVVSTLSLHHWPDLDAAATELARVLRPGGQLMLYDFRFAPLDRALIALRSRAAFTQGGITRTPVRAGWYPVTPYARVNASRTPR
ncbi:class I SAM-dependent methyltransferase [Micromonospora sp. HNM0581]|uniref:class I SAM-dependent methyltransferase n=1 Tax=Micromonospora sp. HNM0581 TaxID=2716341 RepID=UPI00146DCBD7|nr:class I SAM-dependent methyltransferase [Micromonospora sp. HNM0581]NLU77714.1 class I SAM-dependent methyltransferase [Micromonospora sp. HNM0581]